MALEEILAAIDAECERAVAAIDADASARIEQLVDESRARGEADRDRLAAGRDEAAATESSRIVNRARLGVERRLRGAREELYAEAHRRMIERLAEVRAAPGYDDLLGSLIVEARAVLPEADTLIADPRDVTRSRQIVVRLGLELEVTAGGETMGGVTLATRDGRSVTNTLEQRAARAESSLRQLAVERLPALGGGR
jgi:vacuolar-type H+-ATPase subunit E/Vma4